MKRVFDRNLTLKIGASRTRGALEPDGWLTVSLPLSHLPASECFGRQAHIMSLAKVATGPTLRAEIPWERKIPDKIAILECAMGHGLRVIAREKPPTVEGGDEEKGIEAAMECLTSSRWTWVRDGENAVLHVETPSSPQKIEAKFAGGHVRFSSDLASIVNRPEPVCLAALTHFFLALNARLRLARASILEDKALLEAILSPRSLTPVLVDRVVGSLMVGSRLAKRESMALLDNEVAQHYCEFHMKGGEENGCNESQHRGLEPVSQG